MNIERILDDRYMVFLSKEETETLKLLASTFHKGNKSVTLKEIISEGFEVSLSVKQLLEDTEHQSDITKRFCETQLDNVHRRWKDKNNGNTRDTE